MPGIVQACVCEQIYVPKYARFVVKRAHFMVLCVRGGTMWAFKWVEHACMGRKAISGNLYADHQSYPDRCVCSCTSLPR